VSIEKRGKDRYRITVGTGLDPVTGEYARIREEFHGTAPQARRREEELKVAARNGTAVTARSETVAEYLERWISHRERIGKLRPRTAETYRGYVRRELAPRIGSRTVTSTRPNHWQPVFDEMLGGGLSPRSVTQVFRIAHAGFRQAVRWQLITVNPLDGVTPPKVEAAKLTVPTAADVATLIEAIDPGYRVALMVAAGTGARRGEVVALRWGGGVELDGDRGRIHIQGTLQRGRGGELVVLPPKTARSARTLPLSATLTAALRAVRTEQLERRMQLGPVWNDGDYVFDRGDGQPIDPDAFTRAFRAARKAAGLDRVRLHDLRHAVATMLVAGGTDVRTVSDLLGHATVGFTLQTYVHPSVAAAETAVDDVERLLGGEAR
jgi:integrase